MIELRNFYNDGFGWVCRPCERDLANAGPPAELHSRMFREGESESKNPALSNPALAKWADAAHRTLVCPHCGISEQTDIS